MPVPSETEPGRAGLPLIDLAAARELFRTAESSGLGRPGTDEVFDQWLNGSYDVAFYRNADRPLQARAVDTRDEVPEWLSNSRVGHARLEAVCLNPYRPVPPPREEPACVSAEAEAVEETAEAEEAHACTWKGMPGLCSDCEGGNERYATVSGRRAHADVDDDGFGLEDGGGDVPEEDNGYVLELVDACAGGMGEGLAHDLSGGLRQGFRASSLQGLTVLTEVAQMKLDMERWDTAGPWRLSWSFCEGDITDPLDDTEDIDSSGDDLDGGSGDVRYSASVENDGDAHIVQVVGTRWGDQHVFYREPVPEPDGESQDTETLEGLRSLLERATRQVHDEAGYEVNGEWTVNWSRCHVLLAD